MTSHLEKTSMRYLLTLALIFSQALAFAQGIPAKPNPPKLVNDYTGNTLSKAELNALEQKMRAYEDSTSTQVSILIVETLNGYEVVDFAQQTAQSWGIGRSDKENGVFILVAIQDRKAAIVTGYGMEGSITDAATFTIREDYMNPRFKEGNFYKGLDDATTVIFQLASGEYTSDEVAGGKNRGSGGKSFPFGLLFILFFFIIPALVGKRRRGSVGSRSIPWWVWLMMGSGGGNNRHDHWDNFKGGGGGFGGGGGGGFGGFGGGSFGGGGSGGSW
jgi:uncharacterized protein